MAELPAVQVRVPDLLTKEMALLGAVPTGETTVQRRQPFTGDVDLLCRISFVGV